MDNGYPPDMRESIARVEATRSARLSETFPVLKPDEKQALLERFHPDYIREAMREIRVGPNRGERTPTELADLLEGRSWLTPDGLDLDDIDYDTDVLVIGGGGAGSAAALLAREQGARVLMATKLRHGDANTMMAQGGIQAADKENDSPTIHYLDGGGGFSNDPDLVEALVHDAPLVIAWLESLGCMFDKEPDGTMVTIHGGGTSRKRMHSARDYSGAEIMRTLRDEVRSYPEDITVLEFSPAVELLRDERGRVAGAVLQNLETNEHLIVRARATVLATGGSGRLHYQGFATTNHYGATGDGLILAYRVGAKLAFIDTMQYHPTGAAYPEQIVGLLVTEKVRGLGAQVANIDGEQFVFPRETRDAESAAIIRECVERGKGIRTPSGMLGVWLDSPMIDIIHGPGTVQRELPAMVRQFKRFGIDITKEPMLVYPTLHYQNGGIAIDAEGRTGVPGLFVAGEASGGVHGRNRLMGNSLLDVTVFGRRAGAAAARDALETTVGALTLSHLDEWEAQLSDAGLDPQVRAPILLPDYTRRVVGRAALAVDRDAFPDGLADLRRHLAPDGMPDQAQPRLQAGHIEAVRDSLVIARGLHHYGGAPRRADVLGHLGDHVHAEGVQDHIRAEVLGHLPAVGQRLEHDDFGPGRLADNERRQADRPAAEDDHIIAGVDPAPRPPDAVIANGERLHQRPLLVAPGGREQVYVVLFQQQILPHAAGRVRAETHLAEIETGRRHEPPFAVVAAEARQHTVSRHFVARFDRCDVPAHFHRLTGPFVPGGVGSDVVPAFGGLPLKTVDVRTTDARRLHLDEYLVGFGVLHVHFLDPQVVGAMHERNLRFAHIDAPS